MSDSLLEAAWQVWERAYAPYSRFHVGAALQAEDGQIFVGCNVENLSYGLTICAERVALASAAAVGQRRFKRIWIVAETKEPISPCGACRQVLAEFSPNLVVLSSNREGKTGQWSLAELLPRPSTGILDHH